MYNAHLDTLLRRKKMLEEPLLFCKLVLINWQISANGVLITVWSSLIVEANQPKLHIVKMQAKI